jgi:hypothetical protein
MIIKTYRRIQMKIRNSWVVIFLIIAALQLSACAQKQASAEKVSPVQLATMEGTDLKRLVLTEKAAERIDLQTAKVQEESVNGTNRIVVPYSAVIYDLHGETWLYTNPEPLTYVREAIIIDSIDGDKAILVEGPSNGTEVVTVGVAELFGAETGVSK